MNTEQLVLKFHTKLIIRELRLRRQNTHLDTGVWKSESPETTQKNLGGHRVPASNPSMQKAEIGSP